MKIAKYCCFISLIFSIPVSAQTIDSSINFYGANFPQEKIHIHFDKEVYLPGETIWFKAYVFEENLPSARSTNFYAALYDEDGKMLQEKISPIFNSTTDGHFTIPDSLGSKQLICRAYTTWMLNFDSSFLFTKAIKLINSNAKSGDDEIAKKVTLQFFPEGGDIIEGTKNTIAFKANYDNGLPFEVNGAVKKQETGEVIMPLKAEHNGMGRFDLEIDPNEKVYVELPELDTHLEKDQECAIVESVKAAADIFCPVSGEVVEINHKLIDSPQLINNDPYGEGWLFRVKPFERNDTTLLNAAEYSKVVASEAH